LRMMNVNCELQTVCLIHDCRMPQAEASAFYPVETHPGT
jgi:hypothetical protein